MIKLGIASLTILASTIPAWGGVTVLFSDDFESGLDAWTAQTIPAYTPPAYDHDPILFPADGTGIYGPNTSFGGSKCAGYSGDLTELDGTYYVWMERRFPGAVAPGTYTVTFSAKRYVYKATGSADYLVCNRFYFLTNNLYANPWWLNFDGPDPSTSNDGFRSSMWNQETGSGSKTGGKWAQGTRTIDVPINNGNIEIRLMYWEQNPHILGAVSVAWDDLSVVVKQGDTVVWSLTEDFESYASTEELYSVWTPVIHPDSDPNRPNNDTPMLFGPSDPLLGTNIDSPGSVSAGYASNLPYADTTRNQWLQRLLPGILVPGRPYMLRFRCDRYVWRPDHQDWYGSGNRVFLLTDDNYDKIDLALNMSPLAYEPGFREDRWPADPFSSGQPTWQADGVWDHLEVVKELTSNTGNLEIRLLMQDRTGRYRTAVAWDNVALEAITPCSEVRFDADGDGDVDQTDFAALQQCVSGELIAGCECMNSDRDGDIDQTDLEAFEACSSGPGIMADVQCDDDLAPPW